MSQLKQQYKNNIEVKQTKEKLKGKNSIRDNKFIYEDKKNGSLYIYDKDLKDSKYLKINFNNSGQLLVQEYDEKDRLKEFNTQQNFTDFIREPITRLVGKSKGD
jgi:hypothetical protein